MLIKQSVVKPHGQLTVGQRIAREIKKNKYIYLMLVPVLIYYILFKYGPMMNIVMAFQDFKIIKGISGSKWVGLANFVKFFQLKDCWRLIRNTLLLSVYSILFHFPLPIILALMINELKNPKGKKLVQTVSYMPHFISMVVVCALVRTFVSSNGIINSVIGSLVPGWEANNLLGTAGYYRPIHIISGIWQQVGWDSIIYLAALSGVDPQLYEAAYIDGASKMQRIVRVTLPGLLLYNAGIYETADVISTYMYRYGLSNANYAVGAAVGIFNTVISMIILVTVNGLFRRFTEDSLW